MSIIALKGRVFDSVSGDIIENGAVVVEGNVIKAVGKESEVQIPEGAEVKVHENGTIMPGMIDVHVHFGLHSASSLEFYTHTYEERILRTMDDFEKYVDSGFTAVREVGGVTHKLKAIADTKFKAPRISASGLILSQTGGHQDPFQKFPTEMNHVAKLSVLADGVPEVIKAARQNFREGADFIKLNLGGGFIDLGTSVHATEYTEDEIRAVVEVAESKGSYVAAHTHSIAAIQKAIRCGIRCIEHGTFIDDETIELALKHDVYITPTLRMGDSFFRVLDQMSPWLKEKVEAAGGMDLLNTAGARHLRAFKAGVKYGVGTDSVGDKLTDFGGCGREFGCLVEYMGISPAEAIIAGTRTNAEIIQKDDQIGTLEVGKLADLIVVEGNPLENIDLLADSNKVKLVMIDGKVQKELA